MVRCHFSLFFFAGLLNQIGAELLAAESFDGADDGAVVLLQMTAERHEPTTRTIRRKERRAMRRSDGISKLMRVNKQQTVLRIGTASPTKINAETGADVIITLEEDVPANSNVRCLVSAHPNGWDISGGASAYAGGERIGPRKVKCAVPPLDDGDGLVALRLSHGEGVVDLEYVTPFAVSFSRSPYYGMAKGELLVRTDFASNWTQHAKVHIKATMGKQTLVDQEIESHRIYHTLPVDFVGINANIDAKVTVQLLSTSGEELAEAKTVRLARVAQRKNGRVSVDHKSRSLQVNDRPFLPVAWFTSLEHGTEAVIADLQEMARRGANSVMIYNLVPAYSKVKFNRGEPLPWVILDACATMGIKVHVYILDLAESLAYDFDENSDDYKALGEAIDAIKDHPAVLSWYVADDDSGDDLPKLYKYIKKLDPHHPVSIAVAFPRNQNADRFVDGADLIMTETYPADGDGAYKIMNINNHWPTMFMPAITCGRAWTLEEDGYIISREVFRSQLYHAIIGGATGEVWFRFHDAKGWNNPGVPLLEESGALAREMLDLVPSLISAGPWNNNTAVPAATAYARYQNGTQSSNSEAMRAKIFREVSGAVTLLVANGRNEPMQAVVNIGYGTVGVHDDRTNCTEAIVPFEASSWKARRVKVCGGLIEEWLPAWGVQMFRFNGSSDVASEQEPTYALELMRQKQYSKEPQQNLLINPSFETSASFVSAPDAWFCGMADPPKGQPDSSCFTDTSVQRHGRHSGRFVTGANPFLFRMRPATWMNADSYLGKLSDGNYTGSVWAISDQPMELTAVRITANTAGDTESPLERTIARTDIGEYWTQLSFTLEMDDEKNNVEGAGLQLAFKANRPGVIWLDEAQLFDNSKDKSHGLI